MKYNIEKLDNGVELVHVDNELNLKATLASYGAGVYELSYKDRPVILELADFSDYMHSSAFYGKTLGVVAGRLKKDGILEGEEYHLLPDGQFDFSLHGGKLESMSYRNWKTSVKESVKKLSVIFTYTTRKNENGFPGKARITIAYEFSKTKDSFKLLQKATTPSEATFVGLSNHMYFNLDSFDISNYYLKMNCDRIAITDETLLITGLKEVPEVYDFRKSSKLNPRLDKIEKHDFKGTIDDTFLFDDKLGKVMLKGEDITLNIVTDYPAMNIYVDNTMSPLKFKNRDDFKKRRGIALEPQMFLFDRESITLRKGEKYNHYIEYKFKETK